MKTQHASDASKRDGNATEQYFATEPSSEDVRRRMKVTLRGQDAVVEVSNGVFSGSRLDLGTSVLLREVPEPPETGTLLDLGCGWGPVSLALAFASPKADVWAVDVNERALDLTRANAKSNGCEHIHAASPEQVPADLTFDAIWSNHPAGAAYLVAQKNLGADSLIPWLATALGDDYEVSKYHSAKGYRVIEVLRNK